MLPRLFGALLCHLDAYRLKRAPVNQGAIGSSAARPWSRRSISLSRRSLSAVALAAPLVFLSQALTSCGDDSGGGGSCEAGEINPCTCVGGDSGEQVCNAEGTGFGACDCDGTGGGNGGSSGAGGSSGGSSMAGSAGMEDLLPIGFIGAPCQADTDCTDERPGFTCIESNADGEFGTGGPEGGYCTLPCTSNADCANVDGASACAGAGDGETGFCIALCQPGANGLKCGMGDRAQACYPNPMQPTIGACFPACTSDEGCGNGRVCDVGGLNLCVETQSPGGGIGAPCTEATEETDCASQTCLEFGDPNNPGTAAGGFCTMTCTFASEAGCGYPPGGTGPRDAFCLLPVLADGAPGDVGFCYELCDADSDCLQEDWTCDFFGGSVLQTELGRNGQCVPAAVDNDEVGDAGPG